MTSASSKKTQVKYLSISKDQAGQRLDNFLLGHLKGVPRSHVYRLIRKGEVRVNKKRITAFYRLNPGDSVRLPPLFLAEQAKKAAPSEATTKLLAKRVLYEDDSVIVLNKPSGMSVHAGSTVRIGIIEAMRYLYPRFPQLELAHRLDSETSGCLILAKKKRILREIHTLLREGKMNKKYWAITKGRWKEKECRVDLPLHKHYRDGGKHMVNVAREGKAALSIFQPLQLFKQGSLMEVSIHTGRTHQIRVHAQSQGHPIAGDDRYGDAQFNQFARKLGLKRMFLHARSVDFTLPSVGKHIRVVAPLDPELENFIKAFADS